MGFDWNAWFYYDESSKSGLRWKVGIGSGKGNKIFKIRPGDECGTLDSNRHWQVKLHKKLKHVHLIIWEMFYGEVPKGLVIDHEDRDSTNNKLSNLRAVPHAVNSRNKVRNKNNKSGVVGVNYSKNREYAYWVAQWRTLEGRNAAKSFSVNKYGYNEAFRLACEYRTKMIEELNHQGAGYTERHGT